MKTKLLLPSCIVSASSIADENTIDFESAVEEFTEAAIETSPVDFTDPTAAKGTATKALRQDLVMPERSLTIGPH